MNDIMIFSGLTDRITFESRKSVAEVVRLLQGVAAVRCQPVARATIPVVCEAKGHLYVVDAVVSSDGILEHVR